MTPVNSIDTFKFVTLKSPNGGDGMGVVTQHAQLQQRPGVDGTALIQLGFKGDPFQMRSLVDVADFGSAQALRVSYTSLINNGLYVVIVSDANYYTGLGLKYIVMDIQSIARRVGKTAGGILVGRGQAIVEAIWTLVPVFVGTPQITQEWSNFVGV